MKTPEEKVKPFRLVKYFTFSSLIVIFISTIVLSVLKHRLGQNHSEKKQ